MTTETTQQEATMAKTTTRYGIRVRLAGARLTTRVAEKWFRTEATREAWITKQDEAGNLIEVLAYCEE